MDKQDITPSLRPEVNRTTSDLEKATVAHVERSRPGVSALEDEALMSGESQERVSPHCDTFKVLPGSKLTGQLTLFVLSISKANSRVKIYIPVQKVEKVNNGNGRKEDQVEFEKRFLMYPDVIVVVPICWSDVTVRSVVLDLHVCRDSVAQMWCSKRK